MLNRLNITRIFHSVFIALVIILGTFFLNISSNPVALAADNYSAATDTYQETRNPNRVNTTTEELRNSNFNKSEVTEGESIYDRLVEKVDRERDKAVNKKEVAKK